MAKIARLKKDLEERVALLEERVARLEEHATRATPRKAAAPAAKK